MKMDIKQFSENLMLYGADVHQWPEDIRQAGLDALEKFPDLQKLSADHALIIRAKTTLKEKLNKYLDRGLI
ncbi:MAG: hypothetical protein ABFR82_15260 [Nitrospirota bacterium]